MEQYVANNLFLLGAKWIAKDISNLFLAKDFESAEIPILFLSTIASSELIVRGCLLSYEISQKGNSVPETKVAELVYGARSVAFPRFPVLIKDHLGIIDIDFSSHKKVMKLRKSLLLEQVSCSHQLQHTMLQFVFEIIDPLMFKFYNDIVFMHLPEIDGLENSLDSFLDQLNIKRQIHD